MTLRNAGSRSTKHRRSALRELPSDPFKKYYWTAEKVKKARKVIQDEKSCSFSVPLVPFDKAWEASSYIVEYCGGSQKPIKIEYTDDCELLFPATTNVENGNTISFSISSLEIHKTTVWSYQKDWRYLLTAMPFSFVETAVDGQKALNRCLGFFNDLQDYENGPLSPTTDNTIMGIATSMASNNLTKQN